MEALFYHKEDNRIAGCDLCPRRCRIAPEHHGVCKVRTNRGGILYADSFEFPVAVAIDPIEKKPFKRFLPGSKAFSVGTFGCNLGCLFCQNDSLSRNGYEGRQTRRLTAGEVVALALQYKCESVALTYNEPTVFIEYGMDIAKAAHRAGLKVLAVTNGWITPEARAAFYPLVDGANIDVKGFGTFYPEMCKGTLEPVLESCRYLKCELKRHLEITNLVIPGKNDSPEQIDALLDWAEHTLGFDTPLHFSAYFPCADYRESPRTPRETLLKIQAHAKERGFLYVYTGNI